MPAETQYHSATWLLQQHLVAPFLDIVGLFQTIENETVLFDEFFGGFTTSKYRKTSALFHEWTDADHITTRNELTDSAL